VIVAMLGTHPQPFTRAITLVTRLAGDEQVILQHGFTPIPRLPPRAMQFSRLLDWDTLRDLLERCDLVVCHAGVGSIYMALTAGHRPIVIPRLRRLGEHVDDHQLEITGRLERDGLITPCRPGDDIAALRSTAGRAPRRNPPTALRRAVWAAAPLVAA